MSDMPVPMKTPEQIASEEEAMRADGLSTEVHKFADYFGFEEILRHTLPDGVSYVEHRVLNEGDRRAYLDKVNREVRVQRTTGDAVMNMKAGAEKKALLEQAICGWNLQRGGQPVVFSKRALDDFLSSANPRIIDDIEKAIRRANPWLQGEMTVEDIRREITSLEELLADKLKEEEGKAS